MLRGWKSLFCAAGLAVGAAPALAEEITAPMHLVEESGVGAEVGEIVLADSPEGLLLQLRLSAELPAGAHGFHIHENGSCEPGESNGETVAAGAAGGHWDPDGTGKHLGPSGEGHLGDLPVLYIEDGEPTEHTLVAPRITDASQLHGLALMIHSGGDNFRDEPKKLGGGGSRVACGVIP